MDKPTPRINSELREKYVGRTVRLTGKLVSVSCLLFTYHWKKNVLTKNI
jgi:hypothetical protein